MEFAYQGLSLNPAHSHSGFICNLGSVGIIGLAVTLLGHLSTASWTNIACICWKSLYLYCIWADLSDSRELSQFLSLRLSQPSAKMSLHTLLPQQIPSSWRAEGISLFHCQCLAHTRCSMCAHWMRKWMHASLAGAWSAFRRIKKVRRKHIPAWTAYRKTTLVSGVRKDFACSWTL